MYNTETAVTQETSILSTIPPTPAERRARVMNEYKNVRTTTSLFVLVEL